MKIIVLVKQVPDSTEIRVDKVTGTLIRAGVPSIINPDDLGIDESKVGLAGSPTKVHATFTKDVSAETETFDMPAADAAKLIAKTLKEKQIITK